MGAAVGQPVSIGFDAGSIALKVIVRDASGAEVSRSYTRTYGKPVETALRVFDALAVQLAGRPVDVVAGTGSAGRLICELLQAPFMNEVICQATGIRHLHPEVHTLIEMGGQDSKLVFLAHNGSTDQVIADFAMNTNCAAGTGSFLDQQASRLGVRIEDEFGELALKSQCPPRVAGRCSVFAKSDMIHLQQQAAPVYDIVAGLCLGLARNLKSNLGRGMELTRPVAFCGGVASNAGVVHAIRTVFDLKEGELLVPELHAFTGALGALVLCQQERERRGPGYGKPGESRLNVAALSDYLKEPRTTGFRLAPLQAPAKAVGTRKIPVQEGELVEAWFGLDVGSISTKAAVIDKDNNVLAKIYLMTAGRPLDAVRKVLQEIGRQVGGKVKICGAATTGSGRYLTGDFIGADLVINEITAQATAAAVIDPEVDTIFEIGGQDSKYISLDGGVVVDFEMNHACAAGTGSFLEEQAERLGVNIKTEFAKLAFESASPIRLGERCTVFMESDMVSYQQQGASTPDLVAGLCYSIVSNYINRVVGHRKIGRRIFFQGGTAFNKGVVAAFEKFTGRDITVPPDHEVTGAIGAAVLARRHQAQQGSSESKFGGFDLGELQCSVRSFECEACSNNCEINEVTIDGREPLYYGSRCDRYNLKKAQEKKADIPNLFSERHRLLIQHAAIQPGKPQPGEKVIGLPLALSNYQLLPLWGTLLKELGYRVVLSGASTQEVCHKGVEAVLSTPCFPVKVAHGHVLELIDKGVDAIWIPSVITMTQDHAENQYNQLCPYVTSIPYQVEAALVARNANVKLLKPPVQLVQGAKSLYASLKPLVAELGATKSQLKAAVTKAWQAQQAFEEACRARGREVLATLQPGQRAVVVVSRPYNGCDIGVCLNLPEKLRRLEVLPIPMDFLDLREDPGHEDRVIRQMYWKYGQRILRAARIVAASDKLHAIYLSNFSCGPDSFLIGYFKRILAHKPSLILEIDEHSADAGVVTRLEAFLESLANAAPHKPEAKIALPVQATADGVGRTIYIPWMGDTSYAVAAAMRACGQSAQVMPMADEQSLELGRRHCSGKECLPCLITTGDMVRTTQRAEFKPDKSAFFMPGGSGPCRFGQYNMAQQLVLNDLGLHQVPVVSPSHDQDFYDQWKNLSGNFMRVVWVGVCAVDVLTKACLAIRPYEMEAGRTDALYTQWRDALCQLIEKGTDEDEITRQVSLAAAAFAAIPVDRSIPRPRIGVVGEIYVRHHDFSNNNIIRQIERLGGEATLASFAEYMYYSNWTRAGQAWQTFSPKNWIVNLLQDRVQRKIHGRMADHFAPVIGQEIYEPKTQEILDLAEPYIHRSFEGEAVLTVGKFLELHHHGCGGVVNAMPFGCMPSTIVSGLVKRLSAACGGMPAISVSYDGQQDPTLPTRLEALIYQARAHVRRRVDTPAPVLTGML